MQSCPEIKRFVQEILSCFCSEEVSNKSTTKKKAMILREEKSMLVSLC